MPILGPQSPPPDESRSSSASPARHPRSQEAVAQSRPRKAAVRSRKYTPAKLCGTTSRRTVRSRRTGWRFSEPTLRSDPAGSPVVCATASTRSGSPVAGPERVLRCRLRVSYPARLRWSAGPATATPSPRRGRHSSFRAVTAESAPIVIRPILFPKSSVNQRRPSGPAAISAGVAPAVGTGNSLKRPAVVTRPIFPELSVNQSAPSGPVAMPAGPLSGVGTGNSVTSAVAGAGCVYAAPRPAASTQATSFGRMCKGKLLCVGGRVSGACALPPEAREVNGCPPPRCDRPHGATC